MPKEIRNIAFSVLWVLMALVSVVVAPGKSGGASQEDTGSGQKYAKYISYDVNPSKVSPEAMKRREETNRKISSTVTSTRLLDLDQVEGSFYTDFVWLWKGSAKGYSEQEHSHDFDEVIGFIGSKGQKEPNDLGGEMEVWLGGEKHLIHKSCLIWIPKGLKHCPIRFNRIDSPILFFTVGNVGKYSSIRSKQQ
jgi:hypothetical protein